MILKTSQTFGIMPIIPSLNLLMRIKKKHEWKHVSRASHLDNLKVKLPHVCNYSNKELRSWLDGFLFVPFCFRTSCVSQPGILATFPSVRVRLRALPPEMRTNLLKSTRQLLQMYCFLSGRLTVTSRVSAPHLNEAARGSERLRYSQSCWEALTRRWW